MTGLLRMGAMMTLLLGAPSAFAAECPWPTNEPLDVTANMTVVMVNGEMFPVAGSVARMRFGQIMRDCEVSSSTALLFDTWRRQRRVVNITGGVGAFFLWPVWIGTAIVAANAGDTKIAFVQSLAANRQ